MSTSLGGPNPSAPRAGSPYEPGAYDNAIRAALDATSAQESSLGRTPHRARTPMRWWSSRHTPTRSRHRSSETPSVARRVGRYAVNRATKHVGLAL